MSGAKPGTIARAKIGRNDPCPCGSGKKYKQCCEGKKVDDFESVASAAPAGDRRNRLQALRRAAGARFRAGLWSAAILDLKQIVWLDPEDPQAHFDLGVCFARLNGLLEASEHLRRVIELRPSFTAAYSELASVLEERGAALESAAIYRKLARKTDDPLTRRRLTARALMLEGKLDDSENELRRLLTLAPRDIGTHLLLGRLLTERGLFEKAAQEVEPIAATFPEAFALLTRVRRMTERDRPLIDRMCAAVEGTGLTPWVNIAVRFGLGKAFSDLGEYAESMRHYDAANGQTPKLTPLNREVVATRIDSLIATFSAEALERAAHSLSRLPRPDGELPVFVVGMPRTGSTIIDQILSSHPAVASVGESAFWSTRRTDWGLAQNAVPDSGTLARAVEDYCALLRGVDPNARRVVDKALMNFEMLHLIRLAFPDARIIHCRRHPVDTCLSIYFTNFGDRHPYASHRADLVFRYQQYEKLMAHWRSILPPDRFTEVDYEKLVTDREAETRRLVAFIGLEWDDACLAPEKNERVVKTASVWQARQPVYQTSVERWRRYEPWLGELRDLLPAGSDRAPAA